MENIIKERLIIFIKKNDISQKQFCETLGVSHNYISTINKSIPSERLIQIMQCYPDLNIDWLLTGEGEMIRQEPTRAPQLSDDIFTYLREKDNEIRELRNRIDQLTQELHEREIEIVELKKEIHHVDKSAVVAESSQKAG